MSSESQHRLFDLLSFWDNCGGIIDKLNFCVYWLVEQIAACAKKNWCSEKYLHKNEGTNGDKINIDWLWPHVAMTDDRGWLFLARIVFGNAPWSISAFSDVANLAFQVRTSFSLGPKLSNYQYFSAHEGYELWQRNIWLEQKYDRTQLVHFRRDEWGCVVFKAKVQWHPPVGGQGLCGGSTSNLKVVQSSPIEKDDFYGERPKSKISPNVKDNFYGRRPK